MQILLFRFLPIMSIRCSDIISIKKVSKTHFLKPSWIWQSALTTLSAGNRLLGPAVLIQKKGWFEYVAIAPDNADEFIAKVLLQRGNVEDKLWAGGSFVTVFPGKRLS